MPVMAQFLGGVDPTVSIPNDLVQANWLVAGKVKTVHGEPVRSAAVTVAPLVTAGPRTVTTDAQGEFRTMYQLNIKDISEFSLILTVKKKGFQTAHEYVNFGRSVKTWVIPLTLREPGEDPELLSRADLVAGLAPKLRQLGSADGLAAKSEKDYTRGVAEFLDRHRLEQAVPLLNRALEHSPSCIACRTMLSLAELSWEDWEGANRTLTEGVNATLANKKMARSEPLVAYGAWVSWQHDPEKAEPYFLEALKYAPKDALALQEVGRAVLSMQEFDAASDVLKKALAAGAGPEARLLYVEALVGTGSYDEASAEMNRYLDGRDVRKMSVQVRQVWASMQNRKKAETAYAKAKTQKGHEHFDFLGHPPADLIAGLEPAKDQEQLNSILDGVGAKIMELTKNFPNTSSLEAIHQEKLGRKGGVSDAQDQKFRYLCIVPHEVWGPGFVEYRADFAGNEALPKGLSEGFMLTKGFTSTPLYFHPIYRRESSFRYLGRQKVNGRDAFVIAFAQIPKRAHLTGNFRKGQTSVTTFSQGLAWIDPATYQIIRLHTDLLTPLPELRLEKETMSVDFSEVHFIHVKEPLWLPEEVTVTLDWNGRLLRNKHEYSDFKIFDVDASEKIGKPKNSAKSTKETLEPTVTQ
jgi:tetratricopeptide (TPR) repeat protein